MIIPAILQIAQQLSMTPIDYKVGDEVVSKDDPNKILGICTGFAHKNSCIVIDGKVHGGKHYFMKSEFIDYEIL